MKGAIRTRGVFIVEPDLFGTSCAIVSAIGPKDVDKSLEKAMRDALKKHVRIAKTRNDLAKQGLEKGIYYETEIPVTGQGEARDRARYKEELDRRKKGSGGGSSD